MKALPYGISLLVVALMIYQGIAIAPSVCEAPSVRLEEIPGFESKTLEPSEAELHVLPADTIIDKRLYTAPNGAWFQVSLIIGGATKSSIHRPELCLPSQGFQMMSPRSIEVGDIGWRAVTLAHGDNPHLGFAYTFFNQDGYRTSSHVARIFRDVLDRSFRSRIDRWAMITVNACTDDDRVLSMFLSNLRKVVK